MNSFVASQSFINCSSVCRFSVFYSLLCRYLKLNPRDKKSGDDKEYVSLRLELASSSVKPGTVVQASFKLLIYDQSYGKHSEQQGKFATILASN